MGEPVSLVSLLFLLHTFSLPFASLVAPDVVLFVFWISMEMSKANKWEGQIPLLPVWPFCIDCCVFGPRDLLG